VVAGVRHRRDLPRHPDPPAAERCSTVMPVSAKVRVM
jgi:hypothetical protein